MAAPLLLGITDHVEGHADRPSAEIYSEVSEIVVEADRLGIDYAWFSEHHAHAHRGHLPVPLLFALHLAARTERIHLGTAIICLNLHDPLDVAEQVAVADTLTNGRMAVGFGSGSSPEEFRLFGLEVTGEEDRHRRFRDALRVILGAWTRCDTDRPRILPAAADDLAQRSWLAVNSVGSAQIAGEFGFNMLFSHLRTAEQYIQYRAAYAVAGGVGMVAANRPIYVGADEESAWYEAEPALRVLWRRFQREGKIPTDRAEPQCVRELCGHPINFFVGGPASVAEQVRDLRRSVPFDVLNAELNWAGLEQRNVLASLQRLAMDVRGLLAET